MSDVFSCWILESDLFFSFFKKSPAARKLLVAALTGLPPKRFLSVAWYPGSMYKDGFCLRVRTDSGDFFVLEVIPPFSGDAIPDSHPPFFSSIDYGLFSFFHGGKSLFPSVFHQEQPFTASLTTPKPFFPEKFLRVFLTFQEPEPKNPFFYGSFYAPALPFSCRFLNLTSLQPSIPGFPELYALSHFLLVRHSCELPSLACRFPFLSAATPILEEVLREQELLTLFAETPHFAPEASYAISAMCSVNRLLLREKRFDELQKVSDDPEALRNLFQEFQAKGFFVYEKDPCRLHRSQEKREKYI